MYVIFPVAALIIVVDIDLVCLSIRQNSIDEFNERKICGEMRYVATQRVVDGIDRITCLPSINEGEKLFMWRIKTNGSLQIIE